MIPGAAPNCGARSLASSTVHSTRMFCPRPHDKDHDCAVWHPSAKQCTRTSATVTFKLEPIKHKRSDTHMATNTQRVFTLRLVLGPPARRGSNTFHKHDKDRMPSEVPRKTDQANIKRTGRYETQGPQSPLKFTFRRR